MTSLETKDAADELIPALIQCFGVIVLGYLTGRWNLLSESQALGLNAYVTKFALPSVFFRVMVSIDFSGVCWYLVSAVSISKLIAFVLSFAITIILSRSSQLGLAAILAMFVSQSNDVALGYPVLKALYPELASYIYLFAPAQLVVLNPFAYFALEWDQSNRLKHEQSDYSLESVTGPSVSQDVSRCRRALKALWRVVLNPLFFMTVIGVVFNFILHHQIPHYVDGLLKIIAESFAAIALFTLGFGMVGKMSTINQHELYILASILLAKLVLLPFITREMVVLMLPSEHVNKTLRYSTFGFLYGATPTAPPVYLFAAEYGVLPVVIGVGLVLGTFLCAPMMFILSRTVTIYLAEPSEYDHLLGSTVADVSWISIVGCMWTFIVLLLSRKAFRIPHRFVLCHLVCVLLSCIGVVVGSFLRHLERRKFAFQPDLTDQHLQTMPADWIHYIQFSLFFVGCSGARFWTTLLALSLFLQRFRSVCFVLRHQTWLYLVGFVTPVLTTSLLLITSRRERVKDVDPAFQYGRNQLIVSLAVLLVNAVGTLVFVIWYVRLGSGTGDMGQSFRKDPGPAERRVSMRDPCPVVKPNSDPQTTEDVTASPNMGSTSAPEFPDVLESPPDSRRGSQASLVLTNVSHYCQCASPSQRRRCHRLLVRYGRVCTNPFGRGTSHPSTTLSTMATRIQQSSAGGGVGAVDDVLSTNFDPGDGLEFHHQRHLILILVLWTTMFFGICLCLWRLVQEPASGVYLVLEFLDGVFNFGQGIVLFVIFGLDADLIILPIRRFVGRHVRRLFGAVLSATALGNMVEVPDPTGLKERCAQFVTFHLTSCCNSIAKPSDDNPLHPIDRFFTEDALIKWLEVAGLVHSDREAALFVDLLESDGLIVPVDTPAPAVPSATPPSSASHPGSRLLRFTQAAFELHSTEQELLEF